MLRKFIKTNRRLSLAMTPANFAESGAHPMFVKVASLLIMQPTTKRVLDAGAGASWFLPDSYKKRFGLTLIGVDIEGDELALNPVLDERITADVCAELPARNIDLVTVFSGIEHFPDNGAFLKNCAQVLRPGGRVVAQFPGRYATFAVLNRLLPRAATHALLKHLVPGSEGVLGFEAHYDRTNYSAFVEIAEAAGLEVEYHHAAYFHNYFAFFTPLYLLSMLGGLVKFCVGWRDLATFNVFVLRKPGPAEEIAYRPVHVRHAGHVTPQAQAA